MGNSPSHPLVPNGLSRTTSLPHPLVSPSTPLHVAPATYSHAPPQASAALSPPPSSDKSFTPCEWGPPPTHSSIWFPAPSNGLTSEARRYRDEVLAEMRKTEETERLARRGFLGGPGGMGARAERVSAGQGLAKRMSVGKWKGAGMVGSMMERGRSWRGSKTGVEITTTGGSKISRRGSQELDRQESKDDPRPDSDFGPTGIDGLPSALRPGRPLTSDAKPVPTPTPKPSTLLTDAKPARTRPYSEVFAGSTRSRTSSFLISPHGRPSNGPHPASLIPGSPRPIQADADPPSSTLRSPSPNTVSLNTPCSETVDSAFVPPVSPPPPDESASSGREGALSPTRLASLLHPLTLTPGSRSWSRSSKSKSWLGVKTDAKDKKTAGKGWSAGRTDVEPEERTELPTSTAQAHLSLPPTPMDPRVAQWSPTPTAPIGERSCVFSPPSDQDSPTSSPVLHNQGTPSTDSPADPLTAAPPHDPSPEAVHGLALTISESTHTFATPRPTSYHLPPNMSISIQCDALIKELTGDFGVSSDALPANLTPSNSLPDQVYAAPLLPSPVISQRALLPPPPASPLANTSPLVPRHPSLSPDDLAAKLEGDLSFQTAPPGLRPVSPSRSTVSSTLHDPEEEAPTLAPSTTATAPTFKRPPKSKARPSRSSLILAVKERLSPSLDSHADVTESRRSSRLLLKLVHGSETRAEEVGGPVGGGGSKRASNGNGDWGMLMHAAAEAEVKMGAGKLERGQERESRILKWRRESVGPGE